jgi:hypothetical protein
MLWAALVVVFVGVLIVADLAIGVFYKVRAWRRRRAHACR